MDCSSPGFPVIHQLLGNRREKEQILSTPGSTDEHVELLCTNGSISHLKKLIKVCVCVNNIPKRIEIVLSYQDLFVCIVRMQFTWTSIAVLLIIAEGWKQPRHMSASQWINTMWYIHAIEYYSTITSNEVLMYTPDTTLISFIWFAHNWEIYRDWK